MQRMSRLFLLPLLALAASLIYFSSSAQEKTPKPDFDMTASYIEACSCDMFFPCYFNTHSTMHEGKHFCRANLVFKVDKGYYKDTRLDGAKVWLATYLVSHCSTGEGSSSVIT